MTADDSLVGIYVELHDTEGLTWFDHFRFYEGDYFEEDLEGVEKQAVDPGDKAAGTWGQIKSAL